LAKHFTDAFAKENKLGPIHFTKEAKDKLLSYPFPGNVRELKALVELAAVMCENNEITENDITFNTLKKEDIFLSQEKSLRQHTCDIIKHYLQKNNNDVIATANKLDIGKSTIYKMMQSGEL
jgi:DNA-binding NtrC family response regulator